MRAHRTPTASRIVAAALAALFLTATVCPLASANTIDDKKAQAASVQKQIDDLNNKAEIASENYNTARDHYDSLTKQVHATEAQIAQIQAHQKKLQRTLDSRANALYREGPLGLLPVLLSSRSFSDFDVTWQMLVNMGKHDADIVKQLKHAKADAQDARTKLVAEQNDAAKQKVTMAANEAAVKARLGQQKQLLAGINADIRDLIAQQQAAEAAAARAQAEAFLAAQRRAEYASSRSSGGGDGGPAGGLSGTSADFGGPAPSGKGAAAVFWAEKALGKPYVWAASGPNAFDCSGLTMWAYRHVGVSLSHSSREQIHEGARVSRSQLEPGDLVFFGSPIHHVGMYVGGGKFIEAPYSGADVRISNLSHRSDFAGACRP